MIRTSRPQLLLMASFVIAGLVPAPAAHATDYSLNTAGAFFDDASRWTPAGVPSTTDTAALGLNNTYTEFFETSPTIQDLNVLRGNVSFVSWINPVVGSFGAQTLAVTGTVLLPNANGNTSLTLGSSGAVPLSLSTSNLLVENGAVLVAQYASQITVGGYFITGDNPAVSSIFNGLVIIGGGSKLTVGATRRIPGGGVYAYPIQQFVGTSGGTGELLLENGASGNYSTLGDLLIADDGSSANGSVALVSGSTLALTGNINLATDGSAGTPTASLEINSANSALAQSDYYGSLGLALRSGIYVGSNGNGSATINIGQTVSGGTLTTGTAGLTINKTGTVNVGSSTSTGTLNVNGDVTVDGGRLQVFSGSLLNLVSGKTLHIKNGGTAYFESFNINGSSVDFVAGSLSYAGNLLVGNGGPLGQNLHLDGTRHLSLTGITTIDPMQALDMGGGTLHTGTIANNGLIYLSSGTVSAGAATLAGGCTLEIYVNGTARNIDYGTLVVSGNLSLSGTLYFDAELFLPAVGDSFDILDWGTRTGTFSSVILPALPAGRFWDTSKLYTTGVLSVVATAGVPGDYNGNGVVDAADYIAWRNNQGTTHVLPNDAIGGTIGIAQYNQWRSHFGQTAGSGSGAVTNAAVPEPATFAMLLFAAVSYSPLRRRAAQKVPATRRRVIHVNKQPIKKRFAASF